MGEAFEARRPFLLPGSRFRRRHRPPPWCHRNLFGQARPDAPGRRSKLEFRRSVLLPGSFGSAAAPSSSLVSPHLIPPARPARAVLRDRVQKARPPPWVFCFSAATPSSSLVSPPFFLSAPAHGVTRPERPAPCDGCRSASHYVYANGMTSGRKCIAGLTNLTIVGIAV